MSHTAAHEYLIWRWKINRQQLKYVKSRLVRRVTEPTKCKTRYYGRRYTPEVTESTVKLVFQTWGCSLKQCSTVNENHEIAAFHFSSDLTTDSTTFDGQPSFVGGSDLTSAEYKSSYAHAGLQRATCRHLPAVNTVSTCVYVWRAGEVMEMRGIIKLSHIQ